MIPFRRRYTLTLAEIDSTGHAFPLSGMPDSGVLHGFAMRARPSNSVTLSDYVKIVAVSGQPTAARVDDLDVLARTVGRVEWANSATQDTVREIVDLDARGAGVSWEESPLWAVLPGTNDAGNGVPLDVEIVLWGVAPKACTCSKKTPARGC